MISFVADHGAGLLLVAGVCPVAAFAQRSGAPSTHAPTRPWVATASSPACRRCARRLGQPAGHHPRRQLRAAAAQEGEEAAAALGLAAAVVAWAEGGFRKTTVHNKGYDYGTQKGVVGRLDALRCCTSRSLHMPLLLRSLPGCLATTPLFLDSS